MTKKEVAIVKRSTATLLITFVGLAITAFGCSGGAPSPPEFERNQTAGIITKGGKPLPLAYLQFVPVGSTPGYGGRAQSNEEGKFVVEGRDQLPGVPLGDYKVLVSTAGPPGDADITEPPPGAVKIPAGYADLEKTPFKIQIVKGDTPLEIAIP